MDPPPGQGRSESAWWLRTLLVLQAPRAVFAALRAEPEALASSRQEPVTALVFLAGMAVALGAARNAELLDDPEFDGLLVAVWVVAAGGVQGLFAYWLGGAALQLGSSAVGKPGTFRRTRHLLAFAVAPLALSLVVVWPVRLAAFGGNIFRAGGSDDGAFALTLDAIEIGFYAWVLGLLVIGVHVLYGWSWGRSIAACSVAAAALVGLGTGLSLLS